MRRFALAMIRARRALVAGVLALAAASAPLSSARAQVFPPGFTSTLIGVGLPNGATCMAPLADGRILVGLKSGVLRMIDASGALVAAPVHTFTNVNVNGETGLLGLALAPDFTTSGALFVHVSRNTTPRMAEIVRLQLTAPTASVSTGAETVLVTLNSSGGVHQGGGLRLGADGKIYTTLGESGNGNNSQSLANRLGKLLRYNLDGTIPADNPTTFANLAGTTSGENRAIYAVGLRNPFTFAVQPDTGRIFLNDVGAGSREEVDAAGAGLNFGWPTTEGDFVQATYPNFTRPLVAYPRTGPLPAGNTIAGGAFYNTPAINLPASFVGDYFFGDNGAGFVMRRDAVSGELTTFVPSGLAGLVAIEVDRAGNLLILRGGYGATSLRRVSFGRCGLADITDIGGSGDSDKQLTVDDLIVFVNAFSDGASCPSGVAGSPCCPADLTGLGGPPAQPDGQLTVDDLIAFVNAYAEGCVAP